MKTILEKMFEKPVWKINRWASEADKLAGRVYSREEAMRLFGIDQATMFEGNILLNEGINELWTLVAGTGATKFDNGNAYLGVGDDGTTAEGATETGLEAVTNKYYVAMDGAFPTYGTSQKATWRATFTGALANFSWQEFTVANGSSNSAKNLNRKKSDQGTKTSGQVWELTLEISLS
jgi:hypothetical protein